jgi:S-adenosylmethionine-dependent methyltransferase
VDDIGDIRAYYDGAVEGEEARLSGNQLEWDLTWRYLEAHLPPPPAHLLELGAATGRYSRELAKRGYQVTAVDLSPQLVAEARRRCGQAGVSERVEHLVADARDLSCLQGRLFDAALIMGPLYHLTEEADRRLVLRQVGGLLAPGSLVVSAHISRLGILGSVMSYYPFWAALPREVESILVHGCDSEAWPRGGFRGYYARPEEIAPLHQSEGFETLILAAVEPAIGADDESYNRLEGENREAWMNLLYRISTEPSTIGASQHLLWIGRKR